MDANAMMVFLGVVVTILALLQGWQMLLARKERKNNHEGNPGNPGLHVQDGVLQRLDTIISKGSAACDKLDESCKALGRMEQRLDDIWGKVNK